MHKPDHVIEIFLQPGEIYFGGRDTRIRTILGSCVSLVFWHPKHLLGGMCHFMLPGRLGKRQGRLDGRYADEAIELMLGEMRACSSHPREYRVKLFGGGNMFPSLVRDGAGRVGSKNVVAARDLIVEHGFNCISEHVEGAGHRNLVFDVWSGVISVRHRSLVSPQKGGVPVSPHSGNGAVPTPLHLPFSSSSPLEPSKHRSDTSHNVPDLPAAHWPVEAGGAGK